MEYGRGMDGCLRRSRHDCCVWAIGEKGKMFDTVEGSMLVTCRVLSWIFISSALAIA